MGLFSAVKKNTRVGVDFLADGIAVAQVHAGKKETGKITRCEFMPVSGRDNRIEALKEWVRAHNLHKSLCVCLLGHDDCDIYQVEKPDVADNELVQAVTWKIKDLIGYNVNEAVVDSYPMPVSSKNNQQQVGVVVARDSVVAGYVEGIRSTGLNLVALDVHELVPANLQLIRASAGQTLALLNLARDSGLLSIFHDSDLYVSRDFKLGMDRLQQNGDEGTAQFDSLLLEVQRSMDYYESYYGLGSVTELHIYPQTEITEQLVVYLRGMTNLDINFVTIGGDADGTAMDFNCFHAYCAALRRMVQ